MPIKPENAAKYPGGSIRSPEWLAIREAVRERAGDRCEECGARHLAYGYRRGDGYFDDLGLDRGAAELHYLEIVPMTTERQVGYFFRIVCTTAHVDNALVDHSLGNLRFWCQRCHLGHDQAMRRAGK